MQILITGVAGFIGASLAKKLLSQGHEVVGIDSLNDYYDVNLKLNRLKEIDSLGNDNFVFHKVDIVDRVVMTQLCKSNAFDVVVHLAAQAGVRHSIEHPQEYVDANLVGFANVLDGCREQKVKHFVYASSSSVYAGNDNFPFNEEDKVDTPVSLYAATKKSNELMAHSYSHLYNFKCTGLRFFTVYGPWGRPDMAPFRFAQRMLNNEHIPVYNNGQMLRDFTYIDDVVEGVKRVVESTNGVDKYNVYNIGRGEPIALLDFIQCLGESLGVEPKLNLLPMQAGDVVKTMADTKALKNDFGYQPTVSIEEGTRLFANWYKSYFGFKS